MTLVWRRVMGALALAATFAAAVLACGPFFTDLLTVAPSKPADAARYARGDLGVVKPTFERRYLVQAYRRLGGLPPLPAIPPRVFSDDPAQTITRVPVAKPRGQFTLLVPDLPNAHSLHVFGPPPG